MDDIKNKIKWMPSINNFFLSRFKESNKILRHQPRPTHREEAPGGGVAIHPMALPSRPAFGSAMVDVFF